MYIIILNEQDFTSVKIKTDIDEAISLAEGYGMSPIGVTVIKYEGDLSDLDIYIGCDFEVDGGEIIYKMVEGELIENN